jgi:hypothetical protein
MASSCGCKDSAINGCSGAAVTRNADGTLNMAMSFGFGPAALVGGPGFVTSTSPSNAPSGCGAGGCYVNYLPIGPCVVRATNVNRFNLTLTGSCTPPLSNSQPLQIIPQRARLVDECKPCDDSLYRDEFEPVLDDGRHTAKFTKNIRDGKYYRECAMLRQADRAWVGDTLTTNAHVPLLFELSCGDGMPVFGPSGLVGNYTLRVRYLERDGYLVSTRPGARLIEFDQLYSRDASVAEANTNCWSGDTRFRLAKLESRVNNGQPWWITVSAAGDIRIVP